MLASGRRNVALLALVGRSAVDLGVMPPLLGALAALLRLRRRLAPGHRRRR